MFKFIEYLTYFGEQIFFTGLMLVAGKVDGMAMLLAALSYCFTLVGTAMFFKNINVGGRK